MLAPWLLLLGTTAPAGLLAAGVPDGEEEKESRDRNPAGGVG